MGEVFHDVEFRIVGHRLLSRVDSDHAVLSPAPGAAPIAALALGLQESQLWPALMRPLHRPFACPLIPYPRHKGPGTRINQDRVRPRVIVSTFDRPSPDFAGHPSLTKARTKILADEFPHFRTCPDARGKLLVRVGLILDVKLMDRQSLRLIRLHESEQIERVCLKNLRLPAQHPIVVDVRLPHPGWWTPRRGEQA